MSRTSRPLDSICGIWKRCLQTRLLDDFTLSQDDNIIVMIDKADTSPHSLKLRWSFGKNPESLRTGYTIEPIVDSSAPSPRVITLKVSFAGQDCIGTYQPELGVLMVHLVGPDETANIMYHFVDDDTVAATITEVKSLEATDRASPVGPTAASTATVHNKLQYGFMFRIRPGSL